MPSSQTILEQAIAFYQKGQLEQAKTICEQLLTIEPNHADALHLLGVFEYQTNNCQRAVELISRAIEINPTNSDFYSNRGSVLQTLKQYEAAVENYNIAISIDPNYAEAYNNRGNALQQLKRFEAALESFNCAIAIQADFAQAYSNRGNTLLELMRFDAAVESYDHAIAINPDFADAYLNRGNALLELMQFEKAVKNYSKAIAINPKLEYVLGTMLHTKMKLCDWGDLNKSVADLVKRIECNEKSSFCFPLFSLSDSLSIQRKAAEIFAIDKRPFNNVLGDIPKHKNPKKIKIGYFSADFNFHPVSILMAELFEYHDKNGFEVIAFSFGPDIKDVMRQRVENAFDHFIDVRNYSDKEAALLCRQMKIDIAVDLGGDTTHSRSGIFSYRAAPIQVNYLGYPGTMGVDYFDYLIADQVLIPNELQHYYAEKIAYLPNSYQPNDAKRVISEKEFTKKELGLPSEGFIFCCFNHNYKITPALFDSWMQILKAVEGSVLFLYIDNKTAEQNLQKEAEVRGVDSSRLIFSGRLAFGYYLARYKVADLFLNTFPYNAGTTASDALWAGLPVLTLSGETLVSRVTASLLNAIELPELITITQKDYESSAIELATHPTKLKSIKAKLVANRLTTPLFNTAVFAKHIESAYTQMVERYHAGLLPDHIYVE